MGNMHAENTETEVVFNLFLCAAEGHVNSIERLGGTIEDHDLVHVSLHAKRGRSNAQICL